MKLVTTKEVALALSVSTEQVLRLVRNEKLPCRILSKRCYRFDMEEVNEWLRRRRGTRCTC